MFAQAQVGDQDRMAERPERVPVRTIATAIGMVLAVVVGLVVLYQARRVLVWIVIALFFAVALYPVTNWTQRLVRRRSVATLLVFFVGVAALGALLAIPIAGMVQVIVRDVWDAGRGRPKPAPTVGEGEVPVDGAAEKRPSNAPPAS